MIPQITVFLNDGCGRCEHYKTPKCKISTWRAELVKLLEIVTDCGLEEDFKWSQPAFTFDGKTVLIVSAFKDYAFISFFEGVLLSDPKQILVFPGENSQTAKQIRVTSLLEVIDLESTIRNYIAEAIEIEKQGLKVELKKTQDPLPTELVEIFKKNESFKEAFNKLTQGRQRGYLLYFNQPKQSSTKIARITKCKPKIMDGLGLQDNYKNNKV